ncbi:PREDICTED: transmembrane protein 145 isoform X1 [Ceratosolen solmsi marchali]|uniref:Transmembrane protein 145 isoform X1 n=1 Tax=Ceratosolen solmsi marchali TaxID=326594 RepID=A0AAJ7DWM9_9HYME|nr:PREDICTED: transmembrane protein 145 isoform X1 [Ceratosolen solmsi marchali]
MHNAYVIALLINLLFNQFDARILTGQLITNQNWAFLARFCFLSEKGKFQYDFIISSNNTETNLLLYYDSATQWPNVYPSNKTCVERELVLRRDLGQIISLSPYSSYTDISGCSFIGEEKNEIRCTNHREFRSSRPRWWFIALSNCQSKSGLNITYWISLTNAEAGSFWREHFSADEFYILPELIVASFIYILLICFSIYIALKLRTRRLLHVTYKLFMLSLVAQLCGLVCEIFSYVYRALKGFDFTGIFLLGNMFEACSETAFTTLLLLMSLGFTVTKSILTAMEIWRLSAFVTLTISLQLLLFIYESEKFDPGLVLYMYESPPGYGLLALKIWAWVVFVISCYKTSKNAISKFPFYGSLLSLGSSWFLCQPFVVLTITFLTDKWIRESIVKGSSLWVIFIGHATFLYVTRPTSVNNNFPFHIRTFQVVPIGGDGQGHSYELHSQTPTTLFNLSHSTRTVSTIT